MPSTADAFFAVADAAAGGLPESTDKAHRVDAAEFQTAQQALRSGIAMAP